VQHPSQAASEEATRFIVFNVGQADAMLVVHRGKTMLVDAGSARDKRSRHLFRDIPRKLEAITGKRHLDYMVVTHYHADHIGSHASGRYASLGHLGLFGLLADEGVTIDTLIDRGSFVIGPKGSTQRSYEASLPLWLGRVVKRRLVAQEGMMIDMGPNLKVEVVAVNGAGRLLEILRRRPGFFAEYPPSENDYSIALKFTQGDFELFTGGDLTGKDVVRRFGSNASSYNDIESLIAHRVGDVEVYRVNHHGSDHSSNPCFIQVLNPEIAIFSVGRNGYGHPSPRVYHALKRVARVFLTGGAAREVYYEVKPDIVFGDVEVVVEPDGRFYHVQGTRYRSLTEEEERARPDFLDRCQPPSEPASMPALPSGPADKATAGEGDEGHGGAKVKKERAKPVPKPKGQPLDEDVGEGAYDDTPSDD